MGDVVDVSVLVYRGGELNVRLRVEKPNRAVIFDRVVFSAVDDATGQLLPTIVRKGHKWTVDTEGVYTFCADNRGAQVQKVRARPGRRRRRTGS